MVHMMLVLLLCSLPVSALAGKARIGKRIALVQKTTPFVRVTHGKKAQIGTLPFFGYALLVAISSARKGPRALVQGLVVPARLAPQNQGPLQKRPSTTVLPVAPAADGLVRAALKATGFEGAVRIAHGR